MMDDHRWTQMAQWSTAALNAALVGDADAYPQPDDHLARLDAEQRDALDAALANLAAILDGMRGAD